MVSDFLVTAETLPAHITDTAPVAAQPLLAQPVVTVAYSRAGGSIAAQLTHLTGCSVESLLAATFPIAQEPILALPVA